MNKENQLLLENQLCFSIYACSREITKLYRPLLDEIGLTYPQYLVLLSLWEKDQQTVKALGESLFLDSGTLTPMLKRMESAGLIFRKRDSSDERKVFISLTEEGKNIKEKAFCIPEKFFEESNSTQEEFLTLLNQTKSLLQKIQSVNESKK
ncbi:MarR family winged helix-turn-helix transcriptional regulator [Bacillus sp. AFS041924]|uniref:MarR family winged helix-turn-helix transcriptional regulator n=1 Tax=Bacillus sp. AFS041924 TaxID=2033503 RepID=UPI000BFE1722|nr:MarR family transcriptional regulator [Bacillus sp. AFS041924]PGS55801.1 MarR family transcriptional regulator [Bacillus sp. AFS041924]